MSILEMNKILNSVLREQMGDIPYITLQEFIKGKVYQYEGFLFEKGILNESLEVDIGCSYINIEGDMREIYVVCNSKQKMIYLIAIRQDNHIEKSILVNRQF